MDVSDAFLINQIQVYSEIQLFFAILGATRCSLAESVTALLN